MKQIWNAIQIAFLVTELSSITPHYKNKENLA